MEKMKDMLKKIFVWFFSVVICGFLVGVLGNRAYYEYFEKTNLAYAQETFRMAYKDSQLRKKLKITINGKNVNELYITTISLVNNGNSALTRPDFKEESDPLRIEGRRMESVFVDKINTTANSKVKLVKRRGGVRINFKWLNPGDKIVLKVVHHHPGDNIRVRGSFKGISRVTRMDDDGNRLEYTRRHMLIACLSSVFATLLAIVAVIGGLLLSNRLKNQKISRTR